ncbi:MAG: cation:proton antiporter [Acidobacteriales bacterium]|nr:cation:proton antiporter [Terriglobales bacterium]
MYPSIVFIPSFLLAPGEEPAGLLLQMLLVFTSAKLLAEVAEQLKQPSVVGQLVAGILIGPSVLGWVHPTEFLAVLSELGVMFLLFHVGLELRGFQLTRIGLEALLPATLGVILPFMGGIAVMMAIGHPTVEAIFVGAALVATSVGITAHVLASKGLLEERASKVILAAAVIDDVLGLLVLAVVSGLAKGRINFVELGLTTGLAVGFTVLVATWGKKAMAQIVPRVEKRTLSVDGEFTLSIILLFGLSLLAIHAGVAAIIGAFLAGMALAGNVGDRVHQMTSGVTEFLVPFFLVGIGLHLDLSVFRHGSTILLAAIILVVACVTKFLGCGLGSMHLGWADATRIGAGMIPRGEVGMVVAQIGLGLRIIPQDVYGTVVFMSIATTILAPPLVTLSYRSLMRREPAGTVSE